MDQGVLLQPIGSNAKEGGNWLPPLNGSVLVSYLVWE